ncbi:hypothetical protein PtB15_14B230 [Puccinia triticina]|nr:hypothetical protein PtB15_14B230 [Puccinia triticina]
MCFPTLISFQLPANTPANRDSHEPEYGSDASEYEAPGCPPSPPNHSEPIKIRLQMNRTQPPRLNPTPQTIAGSAPAPPITKSKKFLPGRRPRPTKARTVSHPALAPNTALPDCGIEVPRSSQPLSSVQKPQSTQPVKPKSSAKKPAGKRGCPKKDPADASNVTFQSAPLTDADWERITARSAANWSAHWKAENKKIRLQNIGQVRECPLVEVGPGPGSITSKYVNKAATQRLSQRLETAQKDAPSQKLLAAKKTKAPTQPKVDRLKNQDKTSSDHQSSGASDEDQSSRARIESSSMPPTSEKEDTDDSEEDDSDSGDDCNSDPTQTQIPLGPTKEDNFPLHPYLAFM